MSSYSNLPADLPVPADDGACRHLTGLTLAPLKLSTTAEAVIDLSTLTGITVFYVYPMTGRPDVPLPPGWDDIPGARGCTPQSCSFRDHQKELTALHARVFGISVQSSDYQREAKQRLHLPFDLLSDPDLNLKSQLNLPTFKVQDMELYKRVTLICKNATITKVFYPVFPTDQNARDVLSWLRQNKSN